MKDSTIYDVIIIGGGAAGLMCAKLSGEKGLKVLLLEHNSSLGRKISISGGGKCNFTNLYTSNENFSSENIHFYKSALSRYSPYDFIELIEKHNISFFEKHKGQLFCNNSAKDIIAMFQKELTLNDVEVKYKQSLTDISKEEDTFVVKTKSDDFRCTSCVIATGGLSIPSIGASPVGYRVAEKFGHEIKKTLPALVPFKIENNPFESLSGLSLPVNISCNGKSYDEDLLFTHKGLSGPAILQVSLYWNRGDEVQINFLPKYDIESELKKHSKKELKNALNEYLPKRFIDYHFKNFLLNKKVAEISKKDLENIKSNMHYFKIKVDDDEGWRKAEVTKGGVMTCKVSSKTMESNLCSNLFFIGEVLDVTGELGGFNFQWAWASANACAQAL